MTKIHMKGITVNQTKDGDEFVVKLQVVEDNWDAAKKTADHIKNRLKNDLEGQRNLSEK